MVWFVSGVYVVFMIVSFRVSSMLVVIVVVVMKFDWMLLWMMFGMVSMLLVDLFDVLVLLVG